MRKSRFSESQIADTLKQVEGGRHVKEVCRELGITEATYYNWRAKFGSSKDVVEGRHLKALEDENRRLKRMFAELALENAALKDAIASRAQSPLSATSPCKNL